MVESLRERVDAAAKQFERAKKSLLRPDGLMKFAPSENNELTAVAENEFNARLDAVEAEVEELVAAAEERLHTMQHADPSAALTAEELEEANARRAFVADEVSNRTALGLEARVQAIIASNDRAGAYLYSHFIRTRLASDSERSYGDSPAGEANRLQLEQLASELERALDPEGEARLAKLEEEIKELRGLKDYVYLRRNGADDPVSLYLDRAYPSAKG